MEVQKEVDVTPEAPKETLPALKKPDLRSELQAMEPQFKLALPPQIPPERFTRVVMTAVQTNADLMNADKKSLFAACMKAAQDGLLPDGREAALVIFGGKCQYMPMVQGILKKVRNSGEIASLSANIVHGNDEFTYWVDEHGEHMLHRPKVMGDRGEPTHAYASAKTKDGATFLEVMTKEEVEKVRSVSRAKGSGPWTQWWGEMAKKTVIRRLSKRLPMSTDLEDVIRRDDEHFDFASERDAGPSKVDQLKEKLGTN